MSGQAEVISGKVTSVNDTGIQVEGRHQWLNYSLYGDPVPRAAVGDHVVLEVVANKKGSLFIQSLTKNGHQEEPQRRSVYQEAESSGADRHLSIVREVCLKSAIEFYSMITDRVEVREGKPTEVVLMMAEKFERWVIREGSS